MKKLIPALCLLLVSAVLMGTSTFAWFSMNKTVTATGMQVKAITADSLLIWNCKGDEAFDVSAEADEDFGTARLFPASSTDGITFNAVKDGQTFGKGFGGTIASAASSSGAEMEATKSKGMLADSNGALKKDKNNYYAVYTFALKSQSATSATPINVYLSNLGIVNKTAVKVEDSSATYSDGNNITNPSDGNVYFTDENLNTKLNGSAANAYYVAKTDLDKAVRVALFISDEKNSYDSNDLIAIYALNGATPKAVNSEVTFVAGDYSGTNNVVDTNLVKTGTPDANGNNIAYGDGGNSFDIASGDIVYATLVVWVEGEDPECVNVNAGAIFDLDFKFDIYTVTGD